MNEGNSKALLFLAIVWTVLLLFLAHGIYKEAIRIADPKSLRIRNLEDLMNGNP